MSACISREGECGEHRLATEGTAEARFVCSRCFVFDEAAAIAEIDRLTALLASSAPATASEGATCDCESMGGRFGARRDECPEAAGVTSSDGDRGMSECAVTFVAEGARIIGCACGWDVERTTASQAIDAHVEHILAARTAQPEGVKRVEWETRSEWQGCRCGHPGAGCYCSSVTVRTGRRRTVTTYAPVVGPWEVVGDE